MGRLERSALAGHVPVAVEDGVATVTISNPPLGALSAPLRAELLERLDTLAGDDAVSAVVLTGEGAHFATGSLDAEAPRLAELTDRIEGFAKPVVAALNGSALGGGLELALAAHARVARDGVRMGFPDITVGLVPGAGGTQRLPRLVGGVTALKMLLSGRSVVASSGAKIGLVDRATDGDLLSEARGEARRLAASDEPLPRTSERRDRLGQGKEFLEAVAAHRKIAERSPLEAPLRMIECVEAALLLPYDIGRGLEESAHDDLLGSDHSRAMRHVFAAERILATGTKVEGRVTSRPIQTVGLVGARGIASELAVLALDAGFQVIAAEGTDEALEEGVMRIIEHYDARVAKGAMTEQAVEATLDRLTSVCGFRTLGEADVVIDPGVAPSQARIQRLDGAMKAGAILATGAQTVDAATIGRMTSRPADVVGLRFFPGMIRHRAVELAPADETGPRALATARTLARKLDRLIVKTGPGVPGIGARITEALHAAADLCLEDGADVARIDAVLRDWGLPAGSFLWRDVEGLEPRARRQGGKAGRGAGFEPVLVSAGRAGRIAGAGFYAYPQRGKPGEPDPEGARLIADERNRRGARGEGVADRDIRLRCVAAMAGAGAAMLADGTALRPADIDMVAIHGLGFARRTGGVMFAADVIGLEEVARLLSEMEARSARIPPPARMLRDLSRADKGFDALNR